MIEELLAGKEWIENTKVHNGFVDIFLQNAEKRIAEVIKLLRDTPIESVSLRVPSLEEVFLNYTGRTIREQEASSKDRLRTHSRVGRR
jgi:ABC-2 type transport system ATP-binding protein